MQNGLKGLHFKREGEDGLENDQGREFNTKIIVFYIMVQKERDRFQGYFINFSLFSSKILADDFASMKHSVTSLMIFESTTLLL